MQNIKIPGIPEDVEIGKITYKLKEDRYNPLLRRREVIVEIWHIGLPTPTRLEVRKEIANMFKVSEDRVFVRHIYTEFGIGKSKVEAHIYDDPEFGKKIEPLYIQLRNMPREEAKKLMEEIRKKKLEREKKKKK